MRFRLLVTPWLLATVAAAVESFDYVIVGGGTCGLVLANRLSEDPATTVAVIDPGSDLRSDRLVREPAPTLQLFQSLLTNWDYRTVSQANATGRIIDIHSGKGLGGSSLINGMAYVRGDKVQFDAWEQLGNTGWNWNELLPYLKRVEKMFSPESWQVDLGASMRPENHGFHGELHVGYALTRQNASLYGALQKAWAELGQPANDDVNSGSTKGFGICPQTLDPELHLRWDAASAFLSPVEHRPNLQLINGTATRVTWADPGPNSIRPEASGVEYLTFNNELRTVLASREVILSAGTFRTPLILERSGVGNPRLLEELGIEVVVDLPGVGENLVDQSNVPIMFKTGQDIHGGSPYVSFATAADLFGSNTSQLADESRRNIGAWARQVAISNPGHPGGAAAIERIFRIQHDLIFNAGVTMAEIFTTTYAGTVVSTAANLLPFSRGSIHLRDADKDDSAVADTFALDPKYLSIDFDMTAQIAASRLASRLSSTPPLSDLVIGDLLPPDDTDEPPPPVDSSYAQWGKWTARAIGSNWHSMGTASMMSQELGGVVDPRLAVYGTRRLRVVDASILPTQFSGHPMAILYAIADRAAGFIKSDADALDAVNRPDFHEL
ncbi:glucose oxidase [Xylariaceae sp. FL1272]|nr:glucose oxidase [Xylariaceae sp. FL1272]